VQFTNWQNPGQMAAQMYVEVTAAPAATALSHDTAGQSYYSYPTSGVDQRPGGWPAGIYTLRRPLPPRPEVVITSRPPHKRGRAEQNENAGGASSSATPQRQNIDRPPPVDQDSPGAKKGKEPEHLQEPVHPYASVPDATHGIIPGRVKPAAKGAAGHYHNNANIHDPQVARAVYERAMEAPITVTQRELLSLAPEVRAQVADATVRKRVPRDTAAQAMVEEAPDGQDLRRVHFEAMPHATIEEIPDDEAPTSQHEEATLASHMPAAFIAAARAPPPDATIIADPYETYLREHGAGAGTNSEPSIAVAAESRALRAILPLVDGQDKVEAILDPGCQVVAMSEEVCNALALHYDPTIRLHMMSANGGVDQSLGLARNVPFLVGDITLYLQVHVLRAPAYDILLGRPFDVLTQSVVRNYANENQTITILDPNTGRKATVPTIPRGSFKFADRFPKKTPAHQQDF
jgi:Aspartyl protease